MGCAGLIGEALSLVGAGVNEAASLKTQGKMNDIMAANQAQQNQLQQKNQGVFQNSLAQSTPDAAKQQVQVGADKIRTAAQNAQNVPLGLASNTLTPTDKSADSARAGLNRDAVANFAGYGQYGVEQGLKDQYANSQIGVNNNQAQFINSMLPSELGAAQNTYAGLNSFGNLLGAGGSLVGAFSSLGALKPSAMTPLAQVGKYPGTANMLGRIGQNAAIGDWASSPSLSTFGGW